MNFTATSKIIVQGILEPLSLVHTPLMRSYGTQIVGGVSPGNGGEVFQSIPVFDLVEQAIADVDQVDASILFVQPYAVLDAALEAIAAGIRQLIIVTAGVPPLDMVRLSCKAEETNTLIVGPNSAGVIVPGQILVGCHPPACYIPGSIGMISRSGSLTYEVALQLSRMDIGQAIAVSIGSDPIPGSSLQQWLQWLDADDRVEAIVLVGEAGIASEDTTASYMAEVIQKPVIAYIAGQKLPRSQSFGHAKTVTTSRILAAGTDSSNAKQQLDAFKRAGILVTDRLPELHRLVKKALRRRSKPIRA